MTDDTIEISAEIPTRMAEAFRPRSSTAVARMTSGQSSMRERCYGAISAPWKRVTIVMSAQPKPVALGLIVTQALVSACGSAVFQDKQRDRARLMQNMRAEIWSSVFGTEIADLPVMQIPSVIAAAMGLPGAKIACVKHRISRADSTLIPVSSPAAKNILIFRFSEMWLISPVPLRHEGRFAVVTKREAGCDGRESFGRSLCARRPSLLRTVKSCGPGAPTLAPSTRDAR